MRWGSKMNRELKVLREILPKSTQHESKTTTVSSPTHNKNCVGIVVPFKRVLFLCSPFHVHPSLVGVRSLNLSP